MSTDERHLNNRVRRLSEIWQLYIKLGSFPQADRWLKQYAREARFGKKDRQFYSDHFFGLFRAFNRFAAATFMARENVTTEGDLARCCFIPQQEWVNLLQEPSCSWFVPVQVGLEAHPSSLSHSFDQLSAWRTAHPIGLAAILEAGLPPWSYAAWQKKSSQKSFRARAFLDALTQRPPIWLRCQDSHRLAKVMGQLAADGVTIIEQRGDALAVKADHSLTQHGLYIAGEIEIQDFASQQIGQAVAATPGEMIWDVCAGGGGKTLQIAAALQGKGLIYATDLRGYKLEEIERRAERGHYKVVRTKQHDATRPLVLPELVEERGGFDAVLVDAPCSSIGTWRRNPDGLLRSLNFDSLVPLQQAILHQAAKTVRPGGRLIYATCSWAQEENEQVVQAFLTANSDFKATAMHYTGSPEVDADTTFFAVCIKQG